MTTRRDILVVPAAAIAWGIAGTASSADVPNSGRDFIFEGTFLDAAFTHPFGSVARAAVAEHIGSRSRDAAHFWPVDNARDVAVSQFAGLIGAAPDDIAVVPSTMEGENLVCQAMGIGRHFGVVTDLLHYDASLVLYEEKRRQGVPVAFVAPRNNAIRLDDIRRAITPKTKLIVVSLVSSTTGFCHELKALCELAHSRGVLVYADAIQAAGAMPIDVRASGVDFLCAGTYKWLMGDFGTGFLYVRPDRLPLLRRVQLGWRQVAHGPEEHFLPFQRPGRSPGEYRLRGGVAGLIEVSSPAYGALAVAAQTIAHIRSLGVETIAARRQRLIDRVQVALPPLGFTPLTPAGSPGPIVAFAYRDAAARFRKPLADARVKISLYEHRLRISPSIYNTADDIDRLVDVLRKAINPST